MNYFRWQHLADSKSPPNCMDWRHVCMINAVLMGERPKSVVEFGCYRGYSSSAIIEAVERGGVETADFLDPEMQPDLFAFASPRIGVHKEPSSKYEGRAECWVIDGNHGTGAIDDYKAAHAANARIVIIHDTHSYYVMGGHEGSRNIGAYLQMEADATFLDCAFRDGEFTQRGLLIGWFGARPKLETIKRLAFLKDSTPVQILQSYQNQ